MIKKIPMVMPELILEEALEVTKVHSVVGALLKKDGLMETRLFRDHLNLPLVSYIDTVIFPN